MVVLSSDRAGPPLSRRPRGASRRCPPLLPHLSRIPTLSRSGSTPTPTSTSPPRSTSSAGCWPPPRSRPPPPATPRCWPGHAASARCNGSGSRAPARGAPRWPATWSLTATRSSTADLHTAVEADGIASPLALLREVEPARDVLLLSFNANLGYFERFALAATRARQALVTVVGDAGFVHADPMLVRYAGTTYLDGRALCRRGG